jgi:hypothetical protein
MTNTANAHRSSTLPDLWGPALRTVLSPAYGLFAVHQNLAYGGFEAFPMDLTRAWRGGVAGFYGEAMEDVIEGVRAF